MALDVERLDAICAGITPTLPITLEDCAAVFAMLKPYTSEHKLDVEIEPNAIRVAVYPQHGGAIYVRRLLAA